MRYSYFLQIISTVAKNVSYNELIEASCVFACLIAIRTDGPDAQKCVENCCSLWKEFKQSSEYLLILQIMELFQTKNLEELKKALKSLKIIKQNDESDEMIKNEINNAQNEISPDPK
ncbi:hypothetical protein RF11_11640 [Thelohanellus kitauei]|uniref:Uncharacterized protein n=1 Tax=Thelohanellus kitauei TaxID=669202 RepID=A0A0C2M847_THEKT|nr:hypothetical protein RF11_11640 [Thelohanellus kitauei]